MSVGADDPAAGAGGGSGLGEADRVLLLALRAWAPAGPGGRWASRRRAIPTRGSWPGSSPRGPGACATSTRTARPERATGPRRGERLREAHRTEARVDLARVHPSWWARGLREESPAVRRAVVAAAPGPIRPGCRRSSCSTTTTCGRSVRPIPRSWRGRASLWTERLVGGEPRKADDPPVIVAMAGLSPRDGYRLCRYAGEIKLALAGQRRAEWADDFAATAGPEFAVIARHDVRSTPGRRSCPARRLPARIGLLTIARLLADCEPFRVRWALQHWPYAIAKLVRALMPPAAKRSSVMMHVESEVLKAAGDRLRLRGPTCARPGEV